MIGWFVKLAMPTRLTIACGALLVVALIALVAIAWGNSALDTATEGGRAIERAETLEHTIESVEKANEAAIEIRNDPAERCAQCLLDSRTPQNCQSRVPGSANYRLCSADARAD